MIEKPKLDLFMKFKTGEHLHIDCVVVGVISLQEEEYVVNIYNTYTQQRWTQHLSYVNIVYLMFSPEDSAKYLLK